MVELENHHHTTKKTRTNKRGRWRRGNQRGKGESPGLVCYSVAMQTEASIVRSIVNHLRQRGYWYIKTWGAGFGRGGVPDIIVCADGRFVALEVKNEAGRVSKLQELEARHIRKSGGAVEVVRSLDEAIAVLDLHC